MTDRKKRSWTESRINNYNYKVKLGPFGLKFKSLLEKLKINYNDRADNTGNLAICVYAYTDMKLDFDLAYKNGVMSKVLVSKLQTKDYNTNHKKDYYFLVLNKLDCNDIIINSIKGLEILNPNNNNLPFQVIWNKNKTFVYGNIYKKIKMFVDCVNKPKISWKETFISNMKTLKI